jgi:hypothetical protein
VVELGEQSLKISAQRIAAASASEEVTTRIADRVLHARRIESPCDARSPWPRRLVGAAAAALMFLAISQSLRWRDIRPDSVDRPAGGVASQAIAPADATLVDRASSPHRTGHGRSIISLTAKPRSLATARELAVLARETGEGMAAATRLLPGLRPVRTSLLDHSGNSLDPSDQSTPQTSPAWNGVGGWIDLWPTSPQDSRS